MEQTEEQAEELPVTPESAIQSQIFALIRERQGIARSQDPDDLRVVESIGKEIAALEQAQIQLSELRQIKAALAVLKGVVP